MRYGAFLEVSCPIGTKPFFQPALKLLNNLFHFFIHRLAPELYFSDDPAVVRWTKKHGLKIPYKVFGFPHKYLPDFLVEYKDGHKEIHETKGLPLMLWISTKLKQEAAEEYFEKLGWKYKMVTKGKAAFYGKI